MPVFKVVNFMLNSIRRCVWVVEVFDLKESASKRLIGTANDLIKECSQNSLPGQVSRDRMASSAGPAPSASF